MAEAWNIGRLLQWTTDYLAGRGSDSPRLEAEVLLAHARGCKRIELYTSFDEPADEALRDAFRALVRRRAEGTPVAYLVGHREFYSLDFRVTPDVLIPRPETETLVMAVLDAIKARGVDREWTIADVGTGSGVIAITLARHVPRARVTAIDVSPAALEVARDNALRLGVAERVELVASDLFAEIETERRYDFIASNPPYITTAEMAELPRDVREHEPPRALHGGAEGTDVIERLLPQAAARLVEGGTLWMEISPMLHARVAALVDQTAGLVREATIKDTAALDRVVAARRI